jgi:hypothetical protein
MTVLSSAITQMTRHHKSSERFKILVGFSAKAQKKASTVSIGRGYGVRSTRSYCLTNEGGHTKS